MATPPGLDLILKQVRQRAAAEGSDASDGELLRRFGELGEEFALEALVGRHGSLVYGVCRRILGNEVDAEDAFQATFLVLARKAATLGRHTSLAGWLHTVANRIALRARVTAARRRAVVPPTVRPSHDPLAEMTARELCSVLDEELGRLPDKYRLPLLLCCLEGRTRDEAARELNWSLGALKGRLERGRELLRTRLDRRGVCLSAVLLHAGLTSAPVSARLVSATSQAVAALLASGGVGSISAPVLELSSSTLWGTGIVRMGVGIVLLAAIALGAGAAVFSRTPASQAPPAAPVQAAERPSERKAEPAVDKHGDPLPEGAVTLLGSARLRAAGDIHLLTYSPDGKLAATGGRESAIRLWDTKTGKLVRALNRGKKGGFATALLFSKDGSTLMACNESSPTAHRWEVATGRELPAQEWQEGGKECVSAAISPDGKVIASGGSDGTISLRDAVTGQQLARLDWQKGPVGAVAFSPDGKLLASCSESEKNGPIRVGCIDGKDAPRQFKADRTNYQWQSVCFAPDGKHVVAAGSRYVPDGKNAVRSHGTVHCWEVESGTIVRDLLADKDTPRCLSVAYSPDGKTIACAFGDWSVRMWEAATGKLIVTRGETQGNLTYLNGCLAFAPDGKTLAVTKRNSVILWDVASGQPQMPDDGHDDKVDSLAFCASGNVLVSATHNGSLRVWDPRSGRLLRSLPDDSSLGPIAISPDGKVVASGSAWGNPNKSVCLWDVASGRMLREFSEGKEPSTRVTCLAFSADGKLLAAGTGGDRLSRKPAPVPVWEVATGKLVRQLKRLEVGRDFDRVLAVAFSPDGKEVMAGTMMNPEIRRWELSTGNQLKQISLPTKVLDSLVFSPDGTFAAYDLWDTMQIYFHPLAQPGEARTLDVTAQHRSFAFSPDGRFFAMGAWGNGVDPKSYARGVRVWELASGREVCHFNPGVAVTSIAFSGDGKTLATGHADTTVLLWNLLPPPDKTRLPADLWADLAAEDPGRAHHAVADLIGMPREAVTLLKAHLRPVRAADPKVTAKLIAELGSEDFTQREKASKALEHLQEQAREALSKALQGESDLEVKVRLEKLLKRLVLPTSSTGILRDLRAVLVLDQVGSPEARQLLRELSEGDPKALLTREAAAAFHRAGK